MRAGHILDAAAAALRWSEGKDWDAFAKDEQLQAALTYQIQIIGEAASRITPMFRAAHPAIAWDAMIKMRHILVHDYARIDVAIVWRVVTFELPNLVGQLRAALPELDG